MNDTKSQVTIAELQKNDIEVERQRYQGDLKALRRKYDGTQFMTISLKLSEVVSLYFFGLNEVKLAMI